MIQIFKLIIATILISAVSAAYADEPSEGQLAPNFSIERFDKTTFNLADFRGKKSVYLIFWNTWCTYCMKKIPILKQAHKDLNEHIEIIAVNTSLKDSMEKSLLFQKQYAINYPLAFDFGEKVTDLYGVWGTPTEFIIDINGIIQHRDNIPELSSAKLATWNTLANSALAKAAECNEERQSC